MIPSDGEFKGLVSMCEASVGLYEAWRFEQRKMCEELGGLMGVASCLFDDGPAELRVGCWVLFGVLGC